MASPLFPSEVVEEEEASSPPEVEGRGDPSVTAPSTTAVVGEGEGFLFPSPDSIGIKINPFVTRSPKFLFHFFFSPPFFSSLVGRWGSFPVPSVEWGKPEALATGGGIKGPPTSASPLARAIGLGEGYFLPFPISAQKMERNAY